MIVGIAGPTEPRYSLAIGAANLIFMTVGFIISGAIIKRDRFIHVFYVAFCVWILGLLNVAFGYITITQWLKTIFFIWVSMLIGGVLSFAFARAPKEKPVKTE